jgi:hypothetical protein
MLTVMIGLASTTQAPAPAFNSVFNSTVATIIPVFFLALAVQGRVYQDLVQAALTIAREQAASTPSKGYVERFMENSPVLLLAGLSLLATFGMLGEVNSITALYDNSDTSAGRLFTLICVCCLILAVFIGPFMVVGKAMRELTDIQLAANHELPRKVLVNENAAETPSVEPGNPVVPVEGITDESAIGKGLQGSEGDS